MKTILFLFLASSAQALPQINLATQANPNSNLTISSITVPGGNGVGVTYGVTAGSVTVGNAETVVGTMTVQGGSGATYSVKASSGISTPEVELGAGYAHGVFYGNGVGAFVGDGSLLTGIASGGGGSGLTSVSVAGSSVITNGNTKYYISGSSPTITIATAAGQFTLGSEVWFISNTTDVINIVSTSAWAGVYITFPGLAGGVGGSILSTYTTVNGFGGYQFQLPPGGFAMLDFTVANATAAAMISNPYSLVQNCNGTPQVFNTAGSLPTFSQPASCNYDTVTCIGGGANGGQYTGNFGGAGGGGGAYCQAKWAIAPFTQTAMQISSQPSSSYAGAGFNGGTSSFGSLLQAGGGSGGGYNTNPTIGGGGGHCVFTGTYANSTTSVGGSGGNGGASSNDTGGGGGGSGNGAGNGGTGGASSGGAGGTAGSGGGAAGGAGGDQNSSTVHTVFSPGGGGGGGSGTSPSSPGQGAGGSCTVVPSAM